jgi:hypothetical protein
VAGDEVRMPRIANDEVVNLLGPQPHAVEMIAGGDSSPLEFALEIVSGDRAALDPHDRDHNDKEYEKAECDKARDTPEWTPAHDSGVRRNVEPLVSPLLVHGIH